MSIGMFTTVIYILLTMVGGMHPESPYPGIGKVILIVAATLGVIYAINHPSLGKKK